MCVRVYVCVMLTVRFATRIHASHEKSESADPVVSVLDTSECDAARTAR